MMQLRIFKTTLIQPLQQALRAGNTPDISHAGITLPGNQLSGRRRVQDERLYKYFSARFYMPQQAAQMRLRMAAMVEHAHGKHIVKIIQLIRHLCERQGQQIGARGRFYALREGCELGQKQQRGINANDRSGACA